MPRAMLLRCFYFFKLWGVLFTPVLLYAASSSPLLHCPVQPGLGPACATSESPWVLPLAGNPINLINGNKYLLHEDVPSLAEAPLLFIHRHYNAQSGHYAHLGRNWSLHWDIRLQPHAHRLLLADGRQLSLRPHQIRRLSLDSQGFEVQLDADNSLFFNSAGYLIEWRKAPQGRLLLQRYAADHPVWPHALRSLQFGSHQLTFHYQQMAAPESSPTPLLQAITGPFGRIDYHYEWLTDYAQARLQAVHYPDGRRMLYHYEHPSFAFALTGVSWVLHPQQTIPLRSQYWWYDDYGRAIFSARGDMQHWLRIDYAPVHSEPMPSPSSAQRTIYSAHGQADFFFSYSQGQWRLSHSTGAPCYGCPPTELQWEESPQGWLLTWPGVSWLHHHDGRRTLRFFSESDTQSLPELQLDFDAHGSLRSWYRPMTGTTRVQASHPHVQIHYANGDQAWLQRNNEGHPQWVRFIPAPPTALSEQSLSEQMLHEHGRTRLQEPITILFDGVGTHQLSLHHPNESQWWVLNAQQQLQQRSVHRQLTTSQGTVHWTFEERFEYTGSLLRTHHLFEGGSLHYHYDAHNQLQSIEWQPAQGPRQTVLRRHGASLWEHHNGIFDFYGWDASHEHWLIMSPQRLLSWHQHKLRPSTAPQLPPLIEAQQSLWNWPAQQQPTVYRRYLLHDEQGRLVGARTEDSDWQYWAWDTLGQNITPQPNNAPHLRDESGLLRLWQGSGYKPGGAPQDADDSPIQRALFYNAQRRLAAVIEHDALLAWYEHDAFGQRIYAYYPHPHEHSHHFFIFHQHQLVAEWYGDDAQLHALSQGVQPHPIKRRYIYHEERPVAVIDYSTETPRLYAIHSQFVGAPVAVSDDQQQLVWRAHYQPFGAATILHNDFYMPLRFAGHYADPVTGWHDNLLRTYDPHLGHYLNPDPLGPAPNQQVLGYARQRPWQFIDPLGLLLFAFDGTRYDARLNSNVWKFASIYQETAYYQSGPGNASYVDWDALTAWRAHQIIHTQWQHLLNEMLWKDAAQRLAIDIIGFSRGAALARHFGNALLQHTQLGWFHYEDEFGRHYAACIEPRFLGLFDTVAQFGLLGSHNHLYDLSVAPEWAWVAHAVALNEYRQLFPLYSIESAPGEALAPNRVQAGFIGNHGDLGGGHSASRHGDLAQLPLAWMIWQAQSLGLAFAQAEGAALQDITEPILHDDRLPFARYLNTDRHVQMPQHSAPQWLHPHIGQSVRDEVQAFIEYFSDWQRRDSPAVGRVDLEAYYQWLEQNLHWRPITAVN